MTLRAPSGALCLLPVAVGGTGLLVVLGVVMLGRWGWREVRR